LDGRFALAVRAYSLFLYPHGALELPSTKKYLLDAGWDVDILCAHIPHHVGLFSTEKVTFPLLVDVATFAVFIVALPLPPTATEFSIPINKASY
jgi:hypothetical protein